MDAEIWATEIGALCAQRKWTRLRLVYEMRCAAAARKIVLPEDDSLKRMVRLWARGKRGPSQFYAELLSAAFGVTFAAGRPGCPPAVAGTGAGVAPYHGHTGPAADADPGLLWGPGGMPAALEGMVAAMERRQFFELTGGALAAAAHQWMVADPARIAAVLAGRRVDHPAVDDLDRVVDIRRRQDDTLGGAAVYEVAAADLRLTVNILRHCSYTEAVGRRLYAVAAEQARLTGRAAFDAGNPVLAA